MTHLYGELSAQGRGDGKGNNIKMVPLCERKKMQATSNQKAVLQSSVKKENQLRSLFRKEGSKTKEGKSANQCFCSASYKTGQTMMCP